MTAYVPIQRVVIGTTGRVPSWPGRHTGPRVLIEGSWSDWRGRHAAGTAGLQVLACPGPLGRQRRCPALAGERCPLAGCADVIVIANPPDGDEWNALRSAHPQLHPGVPVCVALRGGAGEVQVAETELTVGPDVDVIGVVQGVAEAHCRRSFGIGAREGRRCSLSGGSA